jgi:hypothetical protein
MIDAGVYGRSGMRRKWTDILSFGRRYAVCLEYCILFRFSFAIRVIFRVFLLYCKVSVLFNSLYFLCTITIPHTSGLCPPRYACMPLPDRNIDRSSSDELRFLYGRVLDSLAMVVFSGRDRRNRCSVRRTNRDNVWSTETTRRYGPEISIDLI